jgi:serine/threonine-protein kinase
MDERNNPKTGGGVNNAVATDPGTFRGRATPSSSSSTNSGSHPGIRTNGDVTRVAFPPQFHILRRLGVGGMAEVFAALRHEPSGRDRPVVIKRPLADLAAHPEFLAMFLDEARIASSLHHPNIVRVYEIVHQPETALIVMELVDGKSVSSLLARLERSGQRLESRLAAHVVARAAEGLHYAHTKADASGTPLKIVHRDVSPQNVLVSFTGEVKVIDFGIAHALGRVTQTRTGTRKGKTGYMAPEQARAGAIDARVDVFALGILLWELSCGRRLFVRPDDFRTMNALLVDPIPLPSSVAAVPRELEEITMRALARDPDERYQTADELRAALDAFTASVGGAMPAELGALVKVLFATETPLMRQEVPTHDIAPVVTGTTAHLRKPPPPRRQLALLAAGAVLAATLGAGLGWVGNRVGLASVGRLNERSVRGVAAGASAAPALVSPPAAPAVAAVDVTSNTATPTPSSAPRFAPVPPTPPARPATPAVPSAVEDDERANRKAAAAAARRLRRQQRLKSNPF